MPAPDGTLTPPLSPQERDALLGIALGKTTAETASHMGVSERTVKTYVVRIGRRLGAVERAAIVELAYRQQLLDTPVLLRREVHLSDGQRVILDGLAAGKTVEQMADGERRRLSDVRKDARSTLRALGASTAAHAVTRGWQFGLLGPAAGREALRDVTSVAGPS
ncbi:response regulator transcription factor [Streptomyces sp. NPDC057099]|uniref:response regulator transcription factor n=1 Tax=Streptomyces sp. NPDC057099 TaxID=3346019 RepID=UPI003637A0C4